MAVNIRAASNWPQPTLLVATDPQNSTSLSAS
jgi:hypothetical protein